MDSTHRCKYLGDVISNRNNNLDIIRFFAAVLVIYHHAYLTGDGSVHWFQKFSHGFGTYGNLSVLVFFMISGLLIAGSAEHSKSAYNFMLARIIRILPALIVVSFITAFVIGPIFTEVPVKEYFMDSRTYRYAIFNSLLITTHDLNVFKSNACPTSPNGSLWCLPLEFLCYIACYAAYKLKLFNRKIFIWFVPLFLGIAVINDFRPFLSPFLSIAVNTAVFFFMGMCLYIYRDRIIVAFPKTCIKTHSGSYQVHWNVLLLVLHIGLLIIFSYFGHYVTGTILFLPFIVLYLGYGTEKKFPAFAKNGELSYVIYLWGTPVQQMVTYCFGGSMNPILNFVISMPVIILLAVVSYHLIEKPALKLKAKFKK